MSADLTTRPLVGEADRGVGGVRQTDSHSGEEGLTTVPLEADEDGSLAIVEHLRGRGDLLDAVQGSFGENA